METSKWFLVLLPCLFCSVCFLTHLLLHPRASELKSVNPRWRLGGWSWRCAISCTVAKQQPPDPSVAMGWNPSCFIWDPKLKCNSLGDTKSCSQTKIHRKNKQSDTANCQQNPTVLNALAMADFCRSHNVFVGYTVIHGVGMHQHPHLYLVAPLMFGTLAVLDIGLAVMAIDHP